MIIIYTYKYSEMYQAERWHKDHRYLAPMFVHKESGQHIYAGDIVSFNFTNSELLHLLGKVVKIYTVNKVCSPHYYHRQKATFILK